MKTDSKQYRTLWRWHFYAGVFCIPFVILLAITGGMYLFKPQIEAFRESQYQIDSTAYLRAEPNEQISAALAVLPDAKFQSYRLPQRTSDAIRVTAMSQDVKTYVYVDPYTSKVLGTVAVSSTLIEWVKDLHGELLLGDSGAIFVELVASWAIILILTGLYLWWPRQSKGLAGVLYPRVSKDKRTFLKDLHAVTAIWISSFALFLLISGLPWTVVWGGAFKEIRALAATNSTQSWSTNNASNTPSWGAKPVSEYNLSPSVVLSAQGLAFAYPAELSVSDTQKNHWKLSSQNQNRMLREDAWLTSEGAVLSVKAFEEKGVLDKTIGIAISAHEGQLFGWLNQLLGLLTALGLVCVSVTGLLMWRSRKPAKRLGAPAIPPQFQGQRALLGLLLLPALFLPMLLLSLIAVFCFEWVVNRTMPKTASWLGLTS